VLLEVSRARQLRLVQPNPDFGRATEIVIQGAKMFELGGQLPILDSEPLDFPPARTMFFERPLHCCASP
jgi:hypothetical protein